MQSTLAGQEALLAAVPQQGVYPAFRYLPRAQDAKLTAERAKALAAEEEAKRRLKAEADAAGRVWDAASFKSTVDDESNTAVDRTSFSLKDMLEWGIAHPSAATDTLLDFLAELRRVTAFPVCIAVDGLNLLYEPTAYPTAGDGKLLAAEQLSVPAAFHFLGPAGFQPSMAMARGMVLATTTQRHAKPMRMFDVAKVGGRYRVRVPELTRQEVYSQLLHYQRTGKFLMLSGTARHDTAVPPAASHTPCLHARAQVHVLAPPSHACADPASVDSFAVEFYKTLCAGIPAEIMRAAMYQPI